MFSRILVPFDGRNVSAIALTPALTVARATDASVRLVTVVDGDATPAIRAAAETTLQYVASGLAAKGVAVDTTVRAGAAADEIIAAATEGGADLIAMATHGRSGPARMILGSVADALVRNAHRPVLLVRRDGVAEASEEVNDVVIADAAPA